MLSPQALSPSLFPWPEPSNTALEPVVALEPVRPPDEVTPGDVQVVEVAAESPEVVAEASSVEIMPLSELDPGTTRWSRSSLRAGSTGRRGDLGGGGGRIADRATSERWIADLRRRARLKPSHRGPPA